MELKKVKLGFIPANRGFFSIDLASKMRKQTIETMEGIGIEVVVPSEEMTRAGCVETLEEAEKTARLFRDKDVEGIVVGAVNFGDEQGVALTVKNAALNVPVFIFGCQEEEVLNMKTERRDSFCGLLSIGEALRQIGTKYTVGRLPICYPTDASFKEDIQDFVRVCRVVNGIRNARYGQIGTRPDAFWTCRYDEKALQELGPTVVTLDLSEVIGQVTRMKDNAPGVSEVIEQLTSTVDMSRVPEPSMLKIAKFETVLRKFIAEKNLDALAIQCWTSLQENLGISACSSMSRIGNMGTPCACEVDVYGAMSMHALMLASESPAGLADWNNLHNEDPELVNIWHCGVFPESFAKSKAKMGIHEIISGSVGEENTFGTLETKMKEGPLTLARVTRGTDGCWTAFLCDAEVVETKGETFGFYGWVKIHDLQNIYKNILLRHFPHHVAITSSHVAHILEEAFSNYMEMCTFTSSECCE